MLTPEERNEFDRAKHAKAIRVAIYEVGCAFIALFAADQAARFWPESPSFTLYVAAVAFIWLAVERYNDRKSLSFIEKRLEEDEGV